MNQEVSNIENKKYYIELHTKMMWETTNLFGKGIAFFLAINVALFGYIFNVEIDPQPRFWILMGGLVTSLLFLLYVYGYGKWMWHVGKELKETSISSLPGFQNIENNFSSGQRLFAFFIAGASIITALTSLAYIALLVNST